MTPNSLKRMKSRVVMSGVKMIQTYSSSEQIRLYRTSVFLGRDKGENYHSKIGLTNWVANNFELLDLGELPIDSRRVDPLTRTRWEQHAKDFLKRWMPRHATRHVIRRSMDDREGPVYTIFPHPEDANGMNLMGRNSELPSARFYLNDEGVIRVSGFRGIQRPKIEPTDLVVTIAINEQDAYEAGEWEAAPTDFTNRLRSLESQIMTTEKELQDWFAYLEWMEQMHNENAWQAEIVSATLTQSDPPIAEIIVKADGRDRGLLKRLSQWKGLKCYIAPKPADDDLGEALDTIINKSVVGFVSKFKNQPKGESLVSLKLALWEPLSQNDLHTWVGNILLNDSQDNYGTLRREKQGLERLRDLEAPSDMHQWIFDISKATPGPSEPPALQYPLVDQLNEQQERAVRSALAAPEVYFIQGPPGTGKTTVIAELVNQITQEGQRVLVASQTNLAVDNAFGRLGHKTNVRPIRWLGQFAAKDPDPESKPFLEDNVVQSFFLPSIRNECQVAQTMAEEIRKGWNAINRFQQEGKPLVQLQSSLTASFVQTKKQRERVLNERQSLEKATQDGEEQQIILQSSLEIIKQDKWSEINLNNLNNNNDFTKDLQRIIELETEQSNLTLLEEGKDLMSNLDTSGEVSHEVAKLRQEMDKAAANLDFDKAKRLKGELEVLESQRLELAEDGWTQSSKELARLGRNLEHDELTHLASSLKPPADIDIIVNGFAKEFTAAIESISNNQKKLVKLKADFTKKLIALKEKESLSSTSPTDKEFKSLEDELKEIESQIPLIQRKLKDATEDYNHLTEILPYENSSDVPIDKANLDHLLKLGKEWQNLNHEQYENEGHWFELRNDWIEALNNTSESSIDDLKSIYLQLVNVHGVTTAQAGSWHWYSEHAAEPFDVAIIDEISKATAPEIILASLLGKKVIWVGDHRQLSPGFKDPRKKIDEEDYDEFEGENRFKVMVTTALFERHFTEADESLRTSLNVQYRMHEQIMNAINPFYEGNLKCGLSAELLKEQKQHGFSIRKKDSWGLLNKNSLLIQPQRHLYWVDSAFDRINNYCPEEKKGTSYINEREILLAENLFEEMNSQVSEWKIKLKQKLKEELKRDPTPQEEREEWGTHPHLRHLDHEGKLPVAFITFYLAQKKAFEARVFGGGSNATEERWKHLNVKVDTVDRFQGGERPVVLISMVRSSPLKKNLQKSLKRMLDEKAPSNEWLGRNKGADGQVRIEPPYTGFARSPNRVNVAYSRAQNLLIILGNRWGWKDVQVHIKRDNKTKKEKFNYYGELMNNTIRGGMLDGRDLL